MRRTLGALLATSLLLAGCGAEGDGAETAEERTPTTADERPAGTDGTVRHSWVDFVSASQVGGAVSPAATVLDGEADVSAFTDGFDGSRMRNLVRSAVAEADVAADEALLGAVVTIGCDSPTGVTVERRDGRLLIHPGKVPTTNQCLVPVTTVALVAVPESAV